MEKQCGSCKHFCDGGDWDLCCDIGERRLCYRNYEACDKHEYSEEKVRQLEEQDRKLAEWIRQQKEKKGATAP